MGNPRRAAPIGRGIPVDRSAGAADNDFLQYNATSRKWEFVTAAEAGLLTASASETITGDWIFQDQITIQDTGGTDDLTIQHDGSNVDFDFTNTTYANFNFGGTTYYRFNAGGALELLGGMDMWLRDAGRLRILDSTDTKNVEMYHDSTNLVTDFTSTTTWQINDVPVTFTKTGTRADAAIQIDAAQAEIYFKSTTADADEGNWSILAYDSGNIGRFRISTASDADAFGEYLLEAQRDGTDITEVNLRGDWHWIDGGIKAMGNGSFPGTGWGVELAVAGSAGYVTNYNRSSPAYGELYVRGDPVHIQDNGATRLTVGTTVESFVTFVGTQINLSAAGSQLNIYESDAADPLDRYILDHNGEVLNIYHYDDSGAVFNRPWSMYWGGGGNPWVRGYDSNNQYYYQFSHGGGNVFITKTGSGDYQFSGGWIDSLAGNGVRVRNSSNSDYISLTHDGVDGRITGTNTEAVRFLNTAISMEQYPIAFYQDGSKDYDGFFTIKAPGGAEASVDAASQTGCCVIEFPSAAYSTGPMIHMRIKVYNYADGTTGTVIVGGYPYGAGNAWHSTSAQIIGNIGFTPRVRFMRRGTTAFAVVLGDTADVVHYPQVSVEEISIGYVGQDLTDWGTGWSVTLNVTSLASYTAADDIIPTLLETNTPSSSRLYINGPTAFANSRLNYGYIRDVSGNYGSIEVHGAAGSSGTWSGISCSGRYVLMTEGTRGGLFNDDDNEWVFQHDLDGNDELQIYDAGTVVARTTTRASGSLEVYNNDNSQYERVATITTGSFTGTLTGMTTTVTGTVKYRIVGGVCWLWVDSTITGTSNATTMTMTGLPSVCQPATAHRVIGGRMYDNSFTTHYGVALVTSSGTVTFNLLEGTTNGVFDTELFTASNTKGLSDTWCISYPLD